MEGNSHSHSKDGGAHHHESNITSSQGQRSHGRVKSKSHKSSVKLPPPTNDGEVNLRHYFSTLGLPMGALPAILEVYNSMESRIWVIENSLQMMHKDSHLLVTTANFDKIEKEDGVSRWSELHQCVNFHMKMAARCWIPTKFWLVNKPNDNDVPQRFGICWGDSKNWAAEREHASQIMKDLMPEHTCNPLASEVRQIASRLDTVASRLKEKQKFVSVIVCTQGVPTDTDGKKGANVLKEYLQSLVGLAATLPVKIVFRICSDDDGVLEFYNVVDQKVESDVIDDFYSEATEVYLHNPWLTYGIGIHRLREAGLGTDLMDELDEQPFTLEKIRQWCMEFFVGRSHVFIRHPTLDWGGFIEDLNGLLQREKKVYNPVKNKLCDWIDVGKLHSMYQRHTRKKHSAPLNKCASMPTKKATSEQREQHPRMPHRRNNPLSASVKATSSDLHTSSNHHRRHHHTTFSASMREPPGPREHLGSGYRRTTFDAEIPTSHAGSPSMRRKSSVEGSTARGSQSSQLDLKVAIENWSYKAPKELRPLETLLVEVPTLFPPINQAVEPHDYFAKWKEFSADAFENECGDELKELLKRAVKKAKFFLHPDKLPKDLTDNQSLVLKTIWDVIQESEQATL